ncbi:peptidase M24, structural domain-containing protein [Kockovaella imperatae]|uniref:Methionine aminopeptidase n=1 Tax=Kockovaella imperatae TaxID=4999 RepID=A0A1Y1U6R7_9TREE|nr:peptidase M24, structural domain-containing protein [Kockovaella imperatae]ORX33733.1 peptidase M24, structural domain-containing protein [Kockovaella imperatae]
MIKCAGCQEKEASRLECPKCKKLGIAGSFFCTQDCFKKYWNDHKVIHDIINIAAKAEEEKSATIPPNMRNYAFTGTIRPVYPLSPYREVPKHIQRPDYADDPRGVSACEMAERRTIQVCTPQEIEGIRKVCRLSRDVLDIIASHVRPGITTDELDRICHEECIKRDAYPSPLNYNRFPKSVCTSINEVICHGIPDQRPLVEGDIINLDVSLYHGGFHGDVNGTYPVGKVDEESAELMATTKRSMEAAIAICKPGVAYRDIGNKIEEIIKPKGYGIVRRYTGHGIHHLFHCLPNIAHYGGSKTPGKMEVGHVFTIEPMINLGTENLTHWKDDWTAVTLDGRRSAQFEETILITENGAEILTRYSKNKKKKKKTAGGQAANGVADGDDTPEGAATPTAAQAAQGVESLKVE